MHITVCSVADIFGSSQSIDDFPHPNMLFVISCVILGIIGIGIFILVQCRRLLWMPIFLFTH